MIKIQKENFNLEDEINSIKYKYSNVGAISTFIGYVRDINKSKKVQSLNLEVYEEMAHKSLSSICDKAKKKWSLIDTLVVHRYGDLQINDKIVLIGVFALHRKDSMEACSFIMDFLKKDAPFWKKEVYENNSSWL